MRRGGVGSALYASNCQQLRHAARVVECTVVDDVLIGNARRLRHAEMVVVRGIYDDFVGKLGIAARQQANHVGARSARHCCIEKQ